MTTQDTRNKEDIWTELGPDEESFLLLEILGHRGIKPLTPDEINADMYFMFKKIPKSRLKKALNTLEEMGYLRSKRRNLIQKEYVLVEDESKRRELEGHQSFLFEKYTRAGEFLSSYEKNGKSEPADE